MSCVLVSSSVRERVFRRRVTCIQVRIQALIFVTPYVPSVHSHAHRSRPRFRADASSASRRVEATAASPRVYTRRTGTQDAASHSRVSPGHARLEGHARCTAASLRRPQRPAHASSIRRMAGARSGVSSKCGGAHTAAIGKHICAVSARAAAGRPGGIERRRAAPPVVGLAGGVERLCSPAPARPGGIFMVSTQDNWAPLRKES